MAVSYLAISIRKFNGSKYNKNTPSATTFKIQNAVVHLFSSLILSCDLYSHYGVHRGGGVQNPGHCQLDDSVTSGAIQLPLQTFLVRNKFLSGDVKGLLSESCLHYLVVESSSIIVRNQVVHKEGWIVRIVSVPLWA
jgi:hypothetical protein